jgi:dihydrofolate synthase/folylpolyglutamate synthase
MLGHLSGQFDHVIFTRYLENPRSVPPEELQEIASDLFPGEVCTEIASSPAEAWAAVHRMVQADDLVCITGSFFMAAEMRREIEASTLPGAGLP